MVLEQVQTGGGHVIDVPEFATWRPGSTRSSPISLLTSPPRRSHG
jgi:hypothetical protein